MNRNSLVRKYEKRRYHIRINPFLTVIQTWMQAGAHLASKNMAVSQFGYTPRTARFPIGIYEDCYNQLIFWRETRKKCRGGGRVLFRRYVATSVSVKGLTHDDFKFSILESPAAKTGLACANDFFVWKFGKKAESFLRQIA